MNQIRPTVQLGRDVYIAPTAYVGGDVSLGDQCTVMHHVCIRGDISPIRIGARVNVQDGAVIHTRHGVPLDIEDGVVIGHRAVVHCRSVGPGTLIGTGAIVLDDAVIGAGCIIAAGAVVLPHTRHADGLMVAGMPGTIRRHVTPEDRAMIETIVDRYVALGGRHRNGDFPNAAPRQSR